MSGASPVLAAAAAQWPPLTIAVGPAALPVGLPVLGGESVETVFPTARPSGQSQDFSLFQDGDWLIGVAVAAEQEAPEAAARRLYRDLLQITHAHTLARIWNYVPEINACGHNGLENYRAFCRGRSWAFESEWGGDFKSRLPAASAVGTDAARLAVIFAATTHPARHFENPLQVAAYEYPAEHGPRPPSFARATTVSRREGRDMFVSGTAAIRGHQTIAPGSTAAQLTSTIENLRAIGRECGLGDDLGAGRTRFRHLKVYLRHAHDYADVAATLSRTLLHPRDRVTYVRADICRAALNVEIELTAFGVD